MFIRELSFWMEYGDTTDKNKRRLTAGNHFGVLINLGNALSLTARDQTFEIRQNQFLILNPPAEFTVIPQFPAAYLWLPFQEDSLGSGILPSQAISALAASQGQIFSMEEKISGPVFDLVRKLARACQSKDWSYYAFRNSWISEILMNIFCCIAPPKAAPSSEATTIQKILLYLEENYTEKTSIDMLAAKFYISKYHLMRQFKKETGCTIHHFILHKRIGHACRLISTGLSPSEACYRCGFTDYSLFFKAFTKITGASPSQYRETPQSKIS